MGFIDDVVVNAKSAAEKVGKTAGKIVDVSKLKIGIAEAKANINENYEALGKHVYENCRALLASDAEAAAKMAAVDTLKTSLDALNQDLMDKQSKIACPSCSKLSPVGVTFCSECGTKLAREEQPSAEPEAAETATEEKTAETENNSTEE